MKKLTRIFVLAAFCLTMMTCAAWAQHDENCVDCHSIHYSKSKKMLMNNEPDVSTNSHTNAPLEGVDSMCMGCHSGVEGPEIAIMATHPVGTIPAKVNVPEELLRDGKITCMGCHEPHPSNSNYKYLRADTSDGANMAAFCALCHGEKTASAAK